MQQCSSECRLAVRNTAPAIIAVCAVARQSDTGQLSLFYLPADHTQEDVCVHIPLVRLVEQDHAVLSQ